MTGSYYGGGIGLGWRWKIGEGDKEAVDKVKVSVVRILTWPWVSAPGKFPMESMRLKNDNGISWGEGVEDRSLRDATFKV